MELIRRRWLDLALVALALLVLSSTLPSGRGETRLGGVFTAGSLLVLLARTRWSVLAVVTAFGLAGVGLHLVPRSTAAMFLALLVCFAVAGSLPNRREAVTGGLAGAGVLLVSLLTNPYTQGAADVALTVTFCAVIWGAGLVAAERGRQVQALHVQRDHDVTAAAAHERARIAGELHDIVSHGLSIVILQTVAARMALQDEPVGHDRAVDRRLGVVENTAREALDDMRRLLDLLRPAGDDDPAELAPSVGVAQLPALVEQVRATGHPVELVCDVSGSGLTAGLDATVYRIVQEALTNVLTHAPGAATCVEIRQDVDRLRLSVRNGAATRPPLARVGGGFGLVGMRERTAVYDGTFSAAPDGPGFAVVATFPLAADA